MILFNKTEIWTKLLISRQSPKKGLKCFLYAMLFSLFRCSNVYGKHCIYLFLCLRKLEIENLPYLWNVLSMKWPSYEFLFLWNFLSMKCPSMKCLSMKLLIFEMPYLRNVLSIKCLSIKCLTMNCSVYDVISMKWLQRIHLTRVKQGEHICYLIRC